jgi:hypothetical protein
MQIKLLGSGSAEMDLELEDTDYCGKTYVGDQSFNILRLINEYY